MLGDFGEAMIESIEIGPNTKRGQAIFRVVFGLLGLALAVAGAFHVLAVGIDGAGWHFNVAAAGVFVAMGCFCLFNVVLLRSWRWPAVAFCVSFASVFAVRILFGP